MAVITYIEIQQQQQSLRLSDSVNSTKTQMWSGPKSEMEKWSGPVC